MTLTTRQRQIGLGFALVLTIAVTAVFGDNEPLPGEPQVVSTVVTPAKTPSAVETPPALIALDKMARAPLTTEGANLFAAKSWYVPPPVVQAKPAPPPPPTAPPLPYIYVGKFEGKDGFVVYLGRGNDLLSVKPGEQIGSDYKLETVTAEQLTFVYIPLDTRQTLVTGVK